MKVVVVMVVVVAELGYDGVSRRLTAKVLDLVGKRCTHCPDEGKSKRERVWRALFVGSETLPVRCDALGGSFFGLLCAGVMPEREKCAFFRSCVFDRALPRSSTNPPTRHLCPRHTLSFIETGCLFSVDCSLCMGVRKRQSRSVACHFGPAGEPYRASKLGLVLHAI